MACSSYIGAKRTPGEQPVLRPLNNGAMEGGFALEDKHNPYEAGDRGPGAQESPAWGEASPLP